MHVFASDAFILGTNTNRAPLYYGCVLSILCLSIILLIIALMEHLTPAHFGLEPLNLGKLTLQEEFWCNHQKWLQDCGYMLRPHYMLDWQLSWPVNVRGMEYEDAQPLIVRPLSQLC